jgi:hypothetical protein
VPQPRKPKPKTIAQYKARVEELEAELAVLRTSQTSLGGGPALEVADLMEEAYRELCATQDELAGIRDGIDGLLAHDGANGGGQCGGDLVLLTLDGFGRGAVCLVCSECGKTVTGGFGLTIQLYDQLPERLRAWATRQGLTWTH